MFVLPFVKVIAENEEDARAKYLEKVQEIITKAFGGEVDCRPLDETDEEGWKVEVADENPDTMEQTIWQIADDYSRSGFEPDSYFVNKESRTIEFGYCGGNEEQYVTLGFDEVKEEYGIDLDKYEE